MRRIVGILFVIVGIVLLIGAHVLSDQPDSSLQVTIGGYIVGLVLLVFGGRLAAGSSVGGAARSAARTAGLRIVAFIVVIAFLVGLIYVVVINGSPETKNAVLSAVFECRTQSHTFAPAGGGFSIALPGTENPVDQPDTSSSVTFHQYKQNCGLSNYYIDYVDVPAGSVDTSTVNTTMQSMLSGLSKDYKLISSSATTLGSAPGLQFVAEEPTATIFSQTAIDNGVIYYVNNRFYIVYIATPTSLDSPATDTAFLHSFQANS